LTKHRASGQDSGPGQAADPIGSLVRSLELPKKSDRG
jgi:hypothetical protein